MADVPQPTQVRADYVKEMVHTGETGALAPPRNLDVPYVSGDGTVGATLNCTMGNWTGEPSAYAYAWQSGGTAVGTDAADYVVAATDSGKSIVCIVTATNANGSTAAPPSNAVTIP